MNDFGLSFDHLGLAVRRPETALALLRGLGYRPGAAVFDPEQNVNLCMCTHDTMPAVELISPGTGKSPVDGLVARFSNGIVYHLCYAAADLDATLARMEEAKLRVECVAPPKPAILFGGRRVSFYMVAGAGLIEIIETPLP
jgi:catechol 2,3-dioxygenase-like lactoylglutathione lyase family enzyme